MNPRLFDPYDTSEREHFRHRNLHGHGRLTLVDDSGPVQQFQRLGWQLVVEDVVGGEGHSLPDGFIIDGDPETLRKPQGEVSQQPERCIGVGLLYLHPREEFGEGRIVGGHLVAFPRSEQPDHTAAGVGHAMTGVAWAMVSMPVADPV